MGEADLNGGRDASIGPDPDPIPQPQPNTDPWAPCTNYEQCCTSADMVCVGDPDNNPTCWCKSLWDCSQDERKCEQNKRVPPGGGTWDCTWTDEEYICKGKPDKPPEGGSEWTCQYNATTNLWVCKLQSPPNPSNKPGGTAVWKCKVDNLADKIVCERFENPPPPPPPPPLADGGVPMPDTLQPDTLPPPPATEGNCADGVDNDNDGKVDCKDEDCPSCPPPPCPAGTECCDGKDNNGDGRIDEGNVCANVGEPCPPGAFQTCDCYCGVHRKCKADGTWGPCKVDGNKTCAIAQVTSQSQCPWGTYCDYGKCVIGFIINAQCKKHTDCPVGKVCDLGKCINDKYWPCP